MLTHHKLINISGVTRQTVKPYWFHNIVDIENAKADRLGLRCVFCVIGTDGHAPAISGEFVLCDKHSDKQEVMISLMHNTINGAQE